MTDRFHVRTVAVAFMLVVFQIVQVRLKVVVYDESLVAPSCYLSALFGCAVMFSKVGSLLPVKANSRQRDPPLENGESMSKTPSSQAGRWPSVLNRLFQEG